ncbi:MAG: hypothetical protein J0M01_07650 [Dechloromonas sp.]|jgi:hypothetical protein|nr:hypothetical protein [Dechloromonas sp.]
MTLTIELWQLISLLLTFLGCVAGFAKIILREIERRDDAINERVAQQYARMDEIERGLGDIAALAKASPTHGDLTNVYRAQNRTEEKLNQLIGETRSQSDLLRLIMNQITQKGMQ